MPDSLYIILNPWSDRGGAGRREPAIRAELERLGLEFEVARTAARGDAIGLARAAAESGRFRAVVAAGGDGTVNEVANGLLDSDVPMGILPIGTGNDYIKMFFPAPPSFEQAALRLRDGAPRAVDVGLLGDRAFVNGLGVGFDAQVAVEAARLRRVRGFAVYVVALVKALARFSAPEITITYDGHTLCRRMLLVTSGLGRCHGGGFYITPDAIVDDGLFDLCIVDRLNVLEFMRHVPKVLKGRHTGLRQVTMARASAVTIESAVPLPAHADGEVVAAGRQHFELSLRPGGLRVLS